MTFVRDNFRPLMRLLPLGLLGATLMGCMQPTPYQPRLEGQNTGYTDRELTHNRYRITFTGNSVTPRETVESYLLLRAAEVTRAAGYTSFMFDTPTPAPIPGSRQCLTCRRLADSGAGQAIGVIGAAGDFRTIRPWMWWYAPIIRL